MQKNRFFQTANVDDPLKSGAMVVEGYRLNL